MARVVLAVKVHFLFRVNGPLTNLPKIEINLKKIYKMIRNLSGNFSFKNVRDTSTYFHKNKTHDIGNRWPDIAI